MRNIIPMELTDLNSSIDMAVRPTYGGLPEYGTASGDIASFETNISWLLKKLEADITAQQDLHGYSHPWAGGGGKNLCPPLTWKGWIDNATGAYSLGTSAANSATAELIPVDFTNNTTYVLSYDLSTLPEGTKNIIYAYNANKEYLGRTSGQATNPRTFKNNSFTTSTTSATGDPAYIRIRMYDVTYTEEEIANGKFQVEVGSTATTFEPYENICPITGWDSVKTYVSGKNILSTQNVANRSYGGISVTRNADGSLTLNGTGNTVVLGNISTGLYGTDSTQNDGTKHIPNGEWVLSTGLTSNIGISLQLYGTNEPSGIGDLHFIATTTTTSSKITIDDTYRFNYVRLRANGTFDNVTIYPKIYPYEIYNDPYEQGKINAYTSSLGSTRYGGVLDVTTGKLVVTHGIVDLGTLTWTYTSSYNGIFYGDLPSDAKLIVGTDGSICSNYAPTSGSDWQQLSNGEYIMHNELHAIGRCAVAIKDISYTDATAFKNALTASNAQLVYELATPQTVQLTEQEIESLIGQNNIWANSGQVYVEYHFVEDFEE